MASAARAPPDGPGRPGGSAQPWETARRPGPAGGSVLMGETLASLPRQLSRDRHLSAAFGRLYAANTLGAIAGRVAAGFVLIELLGLTGTLMIGVACSATAGGVALILSRRTDPVP